MGGGGSITGGSCCIDPKCAVQGHCFFFLFFFFSLPFIRRECVTNTLDGSRGKSEMHSSFPSLFPLSLTLREKRCSGYIRNIYIIFFLSSIHDKEVTRFPVSL